MIEQICAVCGEKNEKKLTMFNYGVCLCDRCVEIAAHSFIHDNAERKLKEADRDVEGMSKAEYESMRELKNKLRKELRDELKEAIKKKREEYAKKMAEGFGQIGKVIFLECDCQPDEAMYRNKVKEHNELMCEHRKLWRSFLSVRDERDSISVKFVDVQLDANRLQKRCDELNERLSKCVKKANRGILAASAASLIVGLILGYLMR